MLKRIGNIALICWSIVSNLHAQDLTLDWFQVIQCNSTQSDPSVCCDDSNNTYVTGDFQDQLKVDTFLVSGPQRTNRSSYFARFDENGNCQWFLDLDGEYSHSLIDHNASSLVSVQDFEGMINPPNHSFTQTNGVNNLLLMSMGNDGSVNWARQLTTYRAVPSALEVGKDRILFSGEFKDTLNLDNGVQLNQRRSHLIYTDGFVACYGLDGKYLWSYVLDQNVKGNQIHIDQSNNDVYILGNHSISDWNVNGESVAYVGGSDAFVAKFMEGKLIWVKGFGTSVDDDLVTMTIFNNQILVRSVAWEDFKVDGHIIPKKTDGTLVELLIDKQDGEVNQIIENGTYPGMVSNGSEDFFYNGFRSTQNGFDTSFHFIRTENKSTNHKEVLKISTYMDSQGLIDGDMKNRDLAYVLTSSGDSVRIRDSIIYKPDYRTSIVLKFSDHTLTTIGVPQTSQVALKVFPNPTSDYLNIELQEVNLENGMLTILDNQGRELKSRESRSQVERISIHDLKAGTYYVRFESDLTYRLQKFIVLP
ncbi:T9SS type A sorting domain-containing protein [bacterium SCSIO 12741]|nr:T9SS type A sorting domain-containing protein [bacterium SCSIO 12741]